MSTYCDDCFKPWNLKILKSRYLILKKIDHGSYASVWTCYDLLNKKYYAIKIHNREDYKYGLKETKVYDKIKELKCNYFMNIEDSFDCEHDDDNDSEDCNLHHCCVLELQSYSLYKLFKTMGYKNGLPVDFVIHITKQILTGLQKLHENNYIHADIKPENILLCGTSLENQELMKSLNLDSLVEKILNNTKNKKLRHIEILKDKKKLNTLLTKIKDIMNCDDNESIDRSSDESDSDTSDESTSEESFSINSQSSKENEDINKMYPLNTKESFIKISDLGSCVLPNTKLKKSIQTCYYKSPEILLQLGYNTSSDIWALGCTIFELLTGSILFNPDNVDTNIERYHLFLITQKLGMLTKEMMRQSKKAEIFFTKNLKKIKGNYKKIGCTLIEQLDLYLTTKSCSERDRVYLTDLIVKMLSLDPTHRITATDALKHPLYNHP